jgi:biotin transport system substrate-specific component
MSTRNAAYIAMMAVILCVCSWLTIPFTVPFTMQTFAVYCALLLLGGRRGLLAIGLYILLGLVGLPVFSGFRGGPGHLLGLTGGYIIGFLFTGLGYLLMESKLRSLGFLPRIVLLALDLLPCYLVGTLWFTAVSRLHGSEIGFFGALGLCVVPYILPDLVKVVLAERICARVGKHLKI